MSIFGQQIAGVTWIDMNPGCGISHNTMEEVSWWKYWRSLLSTTSAELASLEVSNPARVALIPASLQFKLLEMVRRRMQSAEVKIKATLTYLNPWIFELGSVWPSLGSSRALEATAPPGQAKEGHLYRALSHTDVLFSLIHTKPI